MPVALAVLAVCDGDGDGDGDGLLGRRGSLSPSLCDPSVHLGIGHLQTTEVWSRRCPRRRGVRPALARWRQVAVPGPAGPLPSVGRGTGRRWSGERPQSGTTRGETRTPQHPTAPGAAQHPQGHGHGLPHGHPRGHGHARGHPPGPARPNAASGARGR